MWIAGSRGARPLESTTKPKTKTDVQAPEWWWIRASIHTFQHGLKTEAQRLNQEAHGPCFRRGGLRIWTENVAGKAGQGNSYRAVTAFCASGSFKGLAAQNARPGAFPVGNGAL